MYGNPCQYFPPRHQNSKLESAAVERECDVIMREQQEVDKQYKEVIIFTRLLTRVCP